MNKYTHWCKMPFLVSFVKSTQSGNGPHDVFGKFGYNINNTIWIFLLIIFVISYLLKQNIQFGDKIWWFLNVHMLHKICYCFVRISFLALYLYLGFFQDFFSNFCFGIFIKIFFYLNFFLLIIFPSFVSFQNYFSSFPSPKLILFSLSFSFFYYFFPSIYFF
jgi:hypothetical protein